MLAVKLRGAHDIGLEEVPKPVLQKDTDAIIKVTATAPCTSEVHYVEGYLPPCPPFIIGHEFVGIVEEVGSAVKNFKPGDRVDVTTYPYCGGCEMCRKGLTCWCTNGALFGSGEGWGNLAGGQAEYVRVPMADNALVVIPDNVTDEQAVFVGDMLATGYYGAEQCDLKPGQTIVIFGSGPVGLCAAQSAALYSPDKIIAVDFLADRLELALKMGATNIINGSNQDVVAEVMKLTNGKGVDAAIDAVGLPASIDNAIKVLSKGGILTILGVPAPGKFDFPLQDAMFKNLTFKIGMTAQHHINTIMRLLEKGTFNVDPLITHIMPFKEFDKAFKIFANHEDGCIKLILKP
ncbi:MAG: zinc-dependent alcohol dehydrogenase [Roseiarcus sp.]